MTVIPITPSLISSAQPFSLTGVNAVATSFDERPINPQNNKPEVGARFLSLQFAFRQTPVWLVDLSAVNQIKPFTQVASMFVDTLGSTHDVTIYFPDSGWQQRVPFNSTAMLNPMTTKGKLPKFYVILDDGNVTNSTDIVNVLPIDTFVPPQFTPQFARSVAYGYGQYFALQPTFSQSTYFDQLIAYSSIITPNYATLISNTQYFITSINIQAASVTNTSGKPQSLILYDGGINGAPIFTNVFYPAGGSTSQNILNLSGLNIISSGVTGGLVMQLANIGSGGQASAGEFAVNIGGGILVT